MMGASMVDTDTICALATPRGVAGLAVVRVSGPRAIEACEMFFQGSFNLQETPGYTIRYGWWLNDESRVDSVTVSVFRCPHSYTGEDVVEIGCHGGSFTSQVIIDSLLSNNVRLANPGEFTRRAFVNQKLDLTQAEAVADIIHAESLVGAQTAARQLAGGFTRRIKQLREGLLDVIGLLELELDFSEEDVEFVDRTRLRTLLCDLVAEVELLGASAQGAEILRSGFHIAVVGYPNAGKSSLFNALLQRSRAIVSEIPGTTRDYIQETILIDGYSVHLSDTAGIRQTDDIIELEGITLTRSIIEQSDAVVVVNDASNGFEHSDGLVDEVRSAFHGVPVVVLQNKVDLTPRLFDTKRPESEIPCSAHTGVGLQSLRERIVGMITSKTGGASDVLVNGRQATLLGLISASLSSARAALDLGQPADLLAVDIRSAIRLLGDISGESWNPDVLDSVFSRFCIGK
jgi:tRNA modification GTPase